MIAPRAAYRKSFFESIQRTAFPPPLYAFAVGKEKMNKKIVNSSWIGQLGRSLVYVTSHVHNIINIGG